MTATPHSQFVVKNRRVSIEQSYALPRTILVVTAGPRGCLLLYRQHEWIPIREHLINLDVQNDLADPNGLWNVRRLLVGYAMDVQVSARCKIQLDDELIGYAKIDGVLLWVPGPVGIELWNPNVYDDVIRTESK